MARPKGAKSNPNRKQLPFKQSQIERVVRAAQAMGLTISSIDVDPSSGKISVGTSPERVEVASVKINPWDKVLEKK